MPRIAREETTAVVEALRESLAGGEALDATMLALLLQAIGSGDRKPRYLPTEAEIHAACVEIRDGRRVNELRYSAINR